jgi:predicted nucleic acid-binding protein
VATKTIICDTDVIIDYWNKNNHRHLNTKDVLENLIQLDNVLLSAVTQMELNIGAVNKDELKRINKNIHQFNIALINDDITETAIQLIQTYNISHGLALPDALIAATAMTLQVQLFTHNIKDYKFISDLTLYDPVDK